MFEVLTESERYLKISKAQETLQDNSSKDFFNKRTFRLTISGFEKFKDKFKFIEVDFKTEVLKMIDLVKISKLNNDLFFIDTKNCKVYTCDQEFANWCRLMQGNILSIRNLK